MPLSGESSKRVLETEVLRHLARQWQLDLEGWIEYRSNFTTPVCFWYGIVCDAETNEIVGIELSRVNLSGTLSAEISILSDLKVIDFSDNHIDGVIPFEIKQLPNLRSINLAYNKIHGTPQGFHSSLSILNISHNELDGTLTTNFGKEAAFLEVLDASFNKMGGLLPHSLGNMPLLKLLDLGHNQFYGTIPPSVGELKQLKGLFLNDNRLMGTIPLSLTREGLSLIQLFIQHNDLSGTVPTALTNLKFMKDLYIDGNKFTGDVPSSLCLMNLNTHSVNNGAEGRDGCNSIACPVNTVSPEGVFPCNLCGGQGYSPYLGHDKTCYHMNEKILLDIFYDKTNGPSWKDSLGWGVDNVGVCKYKGVQCNGSGHIVVLDLSNNGLMGEIPEDIGMLRHLRVLDLSDNMLQGFLPSDLRFPPLEVLNIANNRLEGMIPPMLCHEGDINGNGINGSFNCDLIACSPGTWSPIGRATPAGMEEETGFEVHECRPCHKHGAGFLGAVECGNKHLLDRTTLRGSNDLSTGTGGIILTLAILCSFVGTLVAFIIYRTRKMRQVGLQRNVNLRRNDGFDTDSYCTEATDAHSVSLTKLHLGDDTSVQTEESGTGTAGIFGTGLEGLEMATLSEHYDDLSVESESMLSTRSKSRESLSGKPGRSNGFSGGRSVKEDQSDLWLDVPST